MKIKTSELTGAGGPAEMKYFRSYKTIGQVLKIAEAVAELKKEH